MYILWNVASNDKRNKDRIAEIKAHKQAVFEEVCYILMYDLDWVQVVEIDKENQLFKYKVDVWDKTLYSSEFSREEMAVSFSVDEELMKFQTADQTLSSLNEVQKLLLFTNFLLQFEECKSWIAKR